MLTLSSMVNATGHLVSVVPSEGFEPPSIDEFFPLAFAFQDTPFEMNRIILVRLIVLAFWMVMILLYVRRAKLVPGRAQSAMEYLLDFCRVNVSEEMMGKEMAQKYGPIICAIFISVFAMNIAGLVPGLNMAGTAVAGVPLLLAIVAWFTFVIAGIREQGAAQFFKSSVFPPGVPKILYLLLTPIEFLSTFIVRPFTLFVRLLANMIAGHMLLSMCILGTNFFLLTAGGFMKTFSVFTFIAAVGFTLFELLVAFLQAYIFAVLTAVYVNLAVHSH